ncbi:MAG: DUF4097 family beta strand repeat-containing protein [Agathobacter sp.]
MKKNIYLTVLTIVTVICVIAGSCYHIIGWGVSLADHFVPFFKLKQTEISTKQLTADNTKLNAFSDISVDVKVMDLTLTQGSDFTISYSASEKLVPEYDVDDGTLILTQKGLKSDHLMGMDSKKCSVTITVPEDLQTIDINANVGDIDLNQITAESLSLDANVGDIDVSDCSFEKVVSDANVGDIDFENSGFQNMEISNDVGDVSVSGIDLSDYQLELSTDVGEVSVNDKNYRKSYEQSGNSGCKLTIDNSTGNIEVDYR